MGDQYTDLVAYVAAHPDLRTADAVIDAIRRDRARGVPTYDGPLRVRWIDAALAEPVPVRARPARPMSDLDRRRAGASHMAPMIDLSAVHCGWGRR